MEQEQCEIAWTKRAQLNMKQVYDHVSLNSVQNAAVVLNEIIAAMEKAIENPEVYAPNKYKSENDVSYRAFEIHRHRVAYHFEKSIIRVLKVCHTQREPRSY